MRVFTQKSENGRFEYMWNVFILELDKDQNNFNVNFHNFYLTGTELKRHSVKVIEQTSFHRKDTIML